MKVNLQDKQLMKHFLIQLKKMVINPHYLGNKMENGKLTTTNNILINAKYL